MSLPTLDDPVTGLLPFVAIADMDQGDPEVFISAADTVDTQIYGLLHKVTSKGSGAGLTREAAYGAAIGEGIERFSFSVCHPEDLVFGSYNELAALEANPIEPNRWALYDPIQHGADYASGKQAGSVPTPRFLPDTPIAWTPAQSLTHKRDCLVPACMSYIPYSPVFADRGEQIVTFAISTGAACASSKPEAMLKGLCELIERDAFMIFWRNRLSLPRVRIDSNCELYEIFEKRFRRPGLEYSLIYTTLDLGMPSFAGIIHDSRVPGRGVMIGGSAHPDPNRAALKTLLELVQGLKWMDFMGDSFTPEPNFTNVRSFDDRAKMYATNDLPEAFSFIWDHSNEIDLSEIPHVGTGDIRTDLKLAVDRFETLGLETLAMDMTTADVDECGLSVLRMLVPGIETMEGDHMLPYLGGSRWRTVPVKLGLMASEPDLTMLNPFPHPYP